MGSYFFLSSNLPTLKLSERPDITFAELGHMLAESLNPKDLEKVRVLRRKIDLYNLRSLWFGEKIDLRGNLSEKELDEAILSQFGLPDYVTDFLTRYSEASDRIAHFEELIATYYAEETPEKEGFLKSYLEFERAVRVVLTGLRASKLKMDVNHALRFEDRGDAVVLSVLGSAGGESYDPPYEYRELKELFIRTETSPWNRYYELNAFYFKRVERLVDGPLFSIDWILSYLVKFLIIDEILRLDEEEGKRILKTFAAEK